MVFRDIMVWWYTEGWRQRLAGAKERLESMIDYFSIDLLFKTLFAPFRQISAGAVNGPLDVQLRAFFDQLLSRCIGAVVRLVVVCVAIVTLTVMVLVTAILLVFWIIMPLVPIASILLFVSGWTPWSL